MSAVAVSVLVKIVLGDGLAPFGAALELDVVDVDTSVNNVGINAFAAMTVVDVLETGGTHQYHMATDGRCGIRRSRQGSVAIPTHGWSISRYGDAAARCDARMVENPRHTSRKVPKPSFSLCEIRARP